VSEDEGVFVGSGSFLVDRKQALDKLMRFQLPNPAAFALAWARCASAGGASGFAVSSGGGVLTATFDGRPFTKAELEDPYRCLFEKRTPETDRNRQLAVGLLSVLRLKPQSIRISSGSGPERRTLAVESLEEERFIDPEDGDHSVLVVSWPSLEHGPAREAADLVKAGCVLSPLEISVDGAVLPAWTESAEERSYFEDGVSRGWVAVPRSPADESELELCWHGTVIERVTLKLPLIQVRGAINDDAFTLNASQAGVVRDARYEAALKRLAEPAQALVLSTARALSASPVGPLLQDPYFRRRWRETMEEGREAEASTALGGVLDAAQTLWTMASRLDASSKEEAVVRRALQARWLRRLAARRLRPRAKSSKDDVLNSLWSAPLYVSADGTPLSLDELSEQGKRLSYVPFCSESAPGLSLPFRPLWSVSSGEADLPSRLLELPSRDVTPTIATLMRDPHRRGGEATFEKAGLPPPLIRVQLSIGNIRGEVGLSSLPEFCRLHLLTQGIPSGVLELEGGLRFEAVASEPDRVWDDGPLTAGDTALCSELSQRARDEAVGLYRRIAEEYDPGAASARVAAIRAHLVDYLGFVIRLGGRDPASGGDGDWIRRVRLFQDRDGRWIDYDSVCAALEREPLYAARRGQEHAWQDGKNLILDPDFNAKRLMSLFPGCVRLPIRGRSGVFALAPGLRSCAAAPDGRRCVAAFEIGSDTVHAVLPADESADFVWEKLTLHAADGPGSGLAGHQELIVELMLALVRQAGPLLEASGDPMRRFLLKALGLAPAPWAGAAGKGLWEAFRGKPVFRSPFSAGRTLEDVFAALHVAGGRLTYAFAAAPSGPQPDVILDALELETLRRFQPLGAGNLQLFGAAQRARPVAAVYEPDEPAPSNFLSVFRGKPAVRANERFFIERRYVGRGLDVWIGLSTRLPPPPAAFIEGAPAIDLTGLPRIASILADTGAGFDGADATPALMDFLRQFYEEIASRWPVAKLSSPGHLTAQRYALEALRLAPLQPELFTGWAPVLRKIRGLKMFTSLKGGLLSLDEIVEISAVDGVLLFADPALPVWAIDEGRPIPVLRYPKVVAEILSAKGPIKVKRFKPAAPPPPPHSRLRPVIVFRAEPAAAAPEAAPALPVFNNEVRRTPEDLARRNPVVEAAFVLLSGLSGRKGLKLPRHELSDLRLDNGFDGTLLIQEGTWTLNSDDALVRAVLDSSLSTEEQSAYLASVAYTASNRLKNLVSDLDDIRFHEALADTL